MRHSTLPLEMYALNGAEYLFFFFLSFFFSLKNLQLSRKIVERTFVEMWGVEREVGLRKGE